MLRKTVSGVGSIGVYVGGVFFLGDGGGHEEAAYWVWQQELSGRFLPFVYLVMVLQQCPLSEKRYRRSVVTNRP